MQVEGGTELGNGAPVVFDRYGGNDHCKKCRVLTFINNLETLQKGK